MIWSNNSPKPFALLWIRVALRFTLMMTSQFPRPGDGSSAHTLWTRDHSLSIPQDRGGKKTKFWHVCLSTLICVHALLVGACQKALQKLISWVGGLSVYCLNLALMVPCLRDQEWSGAFGFSFFCGVLSSHLSFWVVGVPPFELLCFVLTFAHLKLEKCRRDSDFRLCCRGTFHIKGSPFLLLMWLRFQKVF